MAQNDPVLATKSASKSTMNSPTPTDAAPAPATATATASAAQHKLLNIQQPNPTDPASSATPTIVTADLGEHLEPDPEDLEADFEVGEFNEPGALSPFLDPTTASSAFNGGSRSQSAHRDYDTTDSGLEQPAIGRSRSNMSFQALNDSVDRIVKDIRVKFQQLGGGGNHRDRVIPDRLSQIYYSVFKAPPDIVTAIATTTKGPLSQAHFDSIVDSVVDAMEAGIPPQLISQGSSGSYFMYDTTGKVVGVFKPKDEEPYGPLSPKWTKWLHRNLFPCFFGRPCLVPNNGYIGEAGASVLDRQLQSHIVPFTDVVYLSSPAFYYRFFDRRRHYVGGKPLPNKVGSFQVFLHGYQQADVFLKKHPLPDTQPRRGSWTPPYGAIGSTTPVDSTSSTSIEPVFEWTEEVIQQFREELEKLVILDYIMRNTDRGLDNWMIRVEWEAVPVTTTTGGTPQFRKVPRIKIGAIDSGLAFPWKHPDEWRSYPFGWLFLPVSVIGQPFSEKTRNHFLPLLCSSDWWEQTSIAFRQLFSQDSEFNERLYKKQLAVIKGQAFNVVETLKCAEQGPLELVRRTRVMVWDDQMDVPVHVPYPVTSMEVPKWRGQGGPNGDGTDGEGDSSFPNSFRDTDDIEVVLGSYQDTPGAEAVGGISKIATQAKAPRNKSADARLMAPPPSRSSKKRAAATHKSHHHSHDSSQSLEARYHALESLENLKRPGSRSRSRGRNVNVNGNGKVNNVNGVNGNGVNGNGVNGNGNGNGGGVNGRGRGAPHTRLRSTNLFDELISTASDHNERTTGRVKEAEEVGGNGDGDGGVGVGVGVGGQQQQQQQQVKGKGGQIDYQIDHQIEEEPEDTQEPTETDCLLPKPINGLMTNSNLKSTLTLNLNSAAKPKKSLTAAATPTGGPPLKATDPKATDPKAQEQNAQEQNAQEQNATGQTGQQTSTTDLPTDTSSVQSLQLVNNVGFSVVEGDNHATRRVIVERLQTVTSKPPVFTWC